MGQHTIYFWQRIVTPHMVNVAVELYQLGCSVVYVAEQLMSDERADQGWVLPDIGGVKLEVVSNSDDVFDLISSACEDSIHICQGIRANGLVGVAQYMLADAGLVQWVVMETVNDVSWRGFIKRVVYSRLFNKKRNVIVGVLAIGHRTTKWVVSRGVAADSVFPFTYFLSPSESPDIPVKQNHIFRFVFVGQFIARKRLDWLITELSVINEQPFELVVIGSGALEQTLRRQAENALGDKINWVGKLPSSEVGVYMATADCLVLPSSHDGWGAVVSEAIMCGTPVICSDACGSAGVVHASGVGGVFKANSNNELRDLLKTAIQTGSINCEQRNEIIRRSEFITAKEGAKYLLEILYGNKKQYIKPVPPWDKLK